LSILLDNDVAASDPLHEDVLVGLVVGDVAHIAVRVLVEHVLGCCIHFPIVVVFTDIGEAGIVTVYVEGIVVVDGSADVVVQIGIHDFSSSTMHIEFLQQKRESLL